MKIFNLTKSGVAACAIALLISQPPAAEAGGQGFEKNVLEDSSKETVDSKSDLGLGKFASFPFQVSVTVRGGYDDNVNLSSFNEQDSFFTNAAIGLAYNFGNARTRLSLTAGAGITYYFDRDGDGFGDGGGEDFEDYDINAYLGFSIIHKATPRLTLAAVLYASYQSQPDFSTFNNNTFLANRRSQDFFFSSNRFSAGYAWAPRFSTVSSYTLGYVDYDDEIISDFEDRFEHTLGNEFRFLIAPVTTLVAEYRFGIVDYTEDGAFNATRDSTSHFLLGGVDHSFSPRFNVSARAGVEFRNFEDDGGNFFGEDDSRTHPYAEATINYALAQGTSISLFNRFSLEQPNVPDALSRSTYRTALSIRHAITSRISAGLQFAYQHDDNDGNAVVSGFVEDSFDISLSARYAINRNFAFDIGYNHTEVISDEALFREFSRNRYYAGFTFTF